MFGLLGGQAACHGAGGSGAQVILCLGQRAPACSALAGKPVEQLVQVPLDLAHPNSRVALYPRITCIPRANSRQSWRLAASALAPAVVS